MRLDKVHRVAAALAAAVTEADQDDETSGRLLERCATNAVAAIRGDLTGGEAAELDRMLHGTSGRLHAVAVTGWLNGYEQAAAMGAAHQALAALARSAAAQAVQETQPQLPTGVYL